MSNPINVNVAVCSSSFSKDPVLRSKLLDIFPNAKFNDTNTRLKGKDLIDFLSDCERAIIALEKIDSDLLSQLPNLKHISKFGVGLDNINFCSLKENGVTLSWQGGVNKRSVSELTMFFILGLVRGGYFSSLNVSKMEWVKARCEQLKGKKIGIIGLGHIGKDLVKLLKPFNVEIWGNDIEDRSSFAKENNIKLAEKDDIFSSCDVITLHVPKTELTSNLINKQTLSRFKHGSYLINTARGGLINEEDLLDALDDDRISGAAIDVFSIEPVESKRLATHPKLINTPHIGGSAKEAIRLMGESAISGLIKPNFNLEGL